MQNPAALEPEVRADDRRGLHRTNSTAFVVMSNDFVSMAKEKSALPVLLLHHPHFVRIAGLVAPECVG